MRALLLLVLGVLLVGAQARPLGAQTGRGLKQEDSLAPIHSIIDKVCRHIAAAHGARCTDWDADGNFAYYKQFFSNLPTLSVTPTYGQYQVIKPAMPPDNIVGDTAVCSNSATNLTVTCNKQISVSKTDTVSWSATNSIKVGTKSSLSIPGIGSEELSFEYSFALTAGGSTGVTRTFTDTCTAAVPPGGCFKCTIVQEVSKSHVKIPMTLALSGGVGLHHDPAIRNVPGDGDSNTHYYRYRSIGWVLQYALQNGLVDPATQGPLTAWTVDNGAGVLGSNAYWTTVLDVQGADFGTSSVLTTDCDVDPLHPPAPTGRRLAAAGNSTHGTGPTGTGPKAAQGAAGQAPQARRGAPMRLPPPKRLVPRITGHPPVIRAKPAMSRPAFVQMVLQANAQRVKAWGNRPLAI